MAVAKALKGLSMKDLIPEAPAIANYTTGTVLRTCNVTIGPQPLSSCAVQAKSWAIAATDWPPNLVQSIPSLCWHDVILIGLTVLNAWGVTKLLFASPLPRAGVSRRDQDEFTVRSHTNAANAHAAGMYADEIVPVNGSTTENGIKADSTLEKVSKLKPAFVKPHGTHTAANSSFLTDGASACLIMSEERALELGFTPKAFIRGWTYVASDPFEELLLGK